MIKTKINGIEVTIYGYFSPTAKVDRNIDIVLRYDEIKNFKKVSEEFGITTTGTRSIYTKWKPIVDKALESAGGSEA